MPLELQFFLPIHPCRSPWIPSPPADCCSAANLGFSFTSCSLSPRILPFSTSHPRFDDVRLPRTCSRSPPCPDSLAYRRISSSRLVSQCLPLSQSFRVSSKQKYHRMIFSNLHRLAELDACHAAWELVPVAETRMICDENFREMMIGSRVTYLR